MVLYLWYHKTPRREHRQTIFWQCFLRSVSQSNRNKSSSTICNSQHIKADQRSSDKWMHKEDVVHIYNGILLSHKNNKIMLFAATWMDLELIILKLNKSDIESQMPYYVTYMWNLKYKWKHFNKTNNRLTDIKHDSEEEAVTDNTGKNW